MGTLFPLARPSVLFEEDFDLPPVTIAPEPEIIEPVYTGAELEAARQEAWRDGHDTGRGEAETSSEAAARLAINEIARQVREAREGWAAIAEQSAEAVAHLITGAFAAAFPGLCAAHGEAEIRAVARAVLPRLHDEPKVTVRVCPHAVPDIVREIERLDPDALAHVQVIGTDAMGPGDIRVAWRAGEAQRDTARLWSDITSILAPADLMPLAGNATAKEIAHAG